VMELELSLRGSVEMSSSTRADTQTVPQWPFYFLARLAFVLCSLRLTRVRRFFCLWFCLEGLVVVEEVPSRALGLCLLLLEMSWSSSNSSCSSSIKQKLVLQLQMLQQQPECVL
jgi:hypothetical protein